MGLSNKKLPIIIGAAVAVLAIAASAIMYFATSFSSMTMAMLYIAEEDEVPVEETEEPDDPDPDEPEPEDNGEYFDELHKLILHTDLDSIPDDARMPDELNYYLPKANGENWTLKTYLLVYKLLAEICMRPEVNPPGTDIKITPMAIMGKMLTESGLCTSTGYSGFKNTTLLWQSKESMIQQCDTGVASDLTYIWNLHSGNGSHDYDFYASNLSSSAAGYACGGPVGQSYVTSFNWNSNNAIAAIYISTEENPYLDNSKRGIVGTREQIYNSNAIYPTEAMWDDWSKCDMAEYEEIKDSIKQGVFDEDTSMGYKTRPASYFVPDACYTLCLSMRAALEDVNPLNFKAKYGYEYANLVSLAEANINDVNTQYVMQALSLYPQLAPYGEGVTLSQTYCDNKHLGAVAELYGDILYNKISFIPIKDITKSDAIASVGYPASLVAKFVGGVDSLSSWGDLAVSIPSTYTIGTSTITPILSQLESSEWKYSIYRCEFESSDGHTAPYNAVTNFGTTTSNEVYIGAWYSFNCLNAGYLLQESCDAHVRYAYANWGRAENPTPEGLVDGYTCLGDECWDKKYPIESRSIFISDFSEIDFSKIHGESLSSDAINNLDMSILRPLKIASKVNGNNRAVIFSNLGIPVTFEGNKPADLLLFGTYTNHAGDAVDFHVEDYDGTRRTSTSEIHAIADGYVVEIRQFPYHLNTTDLDSQIAFANAAVAAGYNYAACGNMVRLAHVAEDGSIYFTRYLHLKDISHLSIGCAVAQGALLGYTGTTGESTGAHPHIAMMTGDNSSIGFLNFVNSYLYTYVPNAEDRKKLDTKYASYNNYALVIKREDEEGTTWSFSEERYFY